MIKTQGVQCKVNILKLGDNKTYPSKGSIVRCHFVGYFLNGEKFDSTRDRNEPLEFQLGIGEVIEAWEIEIQKMSLGQKILLVAPPELAYGNKGLPGVIPGKTSLQFEIELLAIK